MLEQQSKEQIKMYNNRLYRSCYNEDENDYYEVWNEIKDNELVLKSAIKQTKNKWGEDTLSGLKIAEAILMNYQDVSSNIYNRLVQIIYSNKTIARQHFDKNETFLQLTLYNSSLELTRDQKDFAVSEAMKQSNTTLEYKKQANHHLGGKFDIRYQILMNPNWSIEEKANLVYDFYGNDELWDETLEQWEWAIINDPINYKNAATLDKIELYDYKYEELAKFYQDPKITDSIWEDITLCRLFHQMRPQQWEVKSWENSFDINKEFVKKSDKL